jgi:hypothetical protein
LSGRIVRPAFAVGIAGLVAALGLGWIKGDAGASFFHAYLANYAFFLSLSLGGLFLVAVGHACRAGWNVTVRRLAEVLAANTFWLGVLFLPIVVPVLLGSASLYRWNDPSAVAASELLMHKTVYLNPWFFGIRSAAYFLIWGCLGRFYLDRSTRQDASGDPALTLQMERRSPLALLLFAGTLTFASFDWLMSLAPEWFSTIFGVYYFSGAVLGGVAALVVGAVLLQASGRLVSSITAEHYHDLGKLLLSFVVFWGYIAFSQYMLIWYANIPEETEWYLVRQTGPWRWVSLVLLFVHLVIPFLGLLPRAAKRRKEVLCFWAVWLLAAHWLDLYWLVMPNVAGSGLPPGPIDLACLVGIGGIFLAGLVRTAEGRPLLAGGDPRFDESLAFENI